MMKVILLSILSMTVLVSCGPTYVRGSEDPELDEYAMSTGLDKRDLEQLFDKNMNALMTSRIGLQWKAQEKPPLVAVFPIANETSEHVRDQLDALLAKMEGQLITDGFVRVVDHAMQDQLIEEVKRQQGGAFDETQSRQVGKQLGAEYFLTGRVYDSAERTGKERRVQYMLFMSVVEIETAAKEWQHEADLTKGLVK